MKVFRFAVLALFLFSTGRASADSFCVATDSCIYTGRVSGLALYPAVPSCPDTGGNHLNFSVTTGAWTCGTSGSGGLDVGTSQIANGTTLRVLYQSGTTLTQGQGFTVPADGTVLLKGSGTGANGAVRSQNSLGAFAETTLATYGSATGLTIFGVSSNSLGTIIANGNSLTGLAIGTTTSDPVILGTNGTAALTISTSQNSTFAGTVTASTFTGTGTGGLGWAVVAGADTACETTCTAPCVFGWVLTAGNITGSLLACDDVTADACLCAGAS